MLIYYCFRKRCLPSYYHLVVIVCIHRSSSKIAGPAASSIPFGLMQAICSSLVSLSIYRIPLFSNSLTENIWTLEKLYKLGMEGSCSKMSYFIFMSCALHFRIVEFRWLCVLTLKWSRHIIVVVKRPSEHHMEDWEGDAEITFNWLLQKYGVRMWFWHWHCSFGF